MTLERDDGDDTPADVLTYQELTKELFAAADRPAIEEVCRLLAIHLGCLEHRFGRAAIEESLSALDAPNPTGAQNPAVELGLKTLVAFLSLSTGASEETYRPH